MSIGVRTEEDVSYYTMELTRTTQEKGLDERRLRVELDLQGRILSVRSHSTPSTLFGVTPASLKGRSVVEMVGPWLAGTAVHAAGLVV